MSNGEIWVSDIVFCKYCAGGFTKKLCYRQYSASKAQADEYNEVNARKPEGIVQYGFDHRRSVQTGVDEYSCDKIAYKHCKECQYCCSDRLLLGCMWDLAVCAGNER